VRRWPWIVIPLALVVLAVGVIVVTPRGWAAKLRQAVARTWINPSPQGAPGGDNTRRVSVDFTGEYLGWAMLDRATGEVIGENLDQTSTTESMIKTWLVADFLRRSSERDRAPQASQLNTAREAIRWSDDEAAQELYEANGRDASIERMISMCGLTGTTVHENWWSRTQMSPRDAVRLGACLADGTAAGPEWTQWLLGEMRLVQGTTAPQEQKATRGGGRWGIIDGVPAGQASSVAIKNGWTSYKSDGNWHVNCLAVTDSWTMAVMMRYPAEYGLGYGAGVCKRIAGQLLT
jgi:Beta-lactamase enzyme family